MDEKIPGNGVRIAAHTVYSPLQTRLDDLTNRFNQNRNLPAKVL